MPGTAPLMPALRPELTLMEGARQASGAPTWLIHDPLQNRFIQIDEAVYRTLAVWRAGESASATIERVGSEGAVHLDTDGLAALLEFLHANKLTLDPPAMGWRHFVDDKARARHSLGGWLLHNYLFFRVPLVRPQALLVATLPAARALASPAARAVYLILGLAGLYLVSRQWDAFISTFHGFMSWEGMAVMAVALALVKAAHELGHAYTAVHHGCRVPTMGVAFMLLAPLLYTDVTDAWRLTDRRKRLAIDSAGIRVEIAIAAVALFVWAFLPDGPLRSAAFVLSAVSVISSLAINLNPFMRFDGYYLLSETIGVENLQARASALGRWKLREWLFGLGRPPPDDLPRHLVGPVVAYAYAMWIYRLVLFVGIALIVYHYFFKVLGIILFMVEIGVFVARPIWSELREWWKMRAEIAATGRSRAAALAVASGLALCIVPWSTRIEVPAVVEYRNLQPIHPSRPARVVEVHVRHGARVEAGAPIVTLASPDIDNELRLARTNLRLARLQHARRAADATDREASMVLESTIGALTAKIAGLEREKSELVIRAPFDGHLAEFAPDISAGRWVGPRDRIALIAGAGGRVARGYIPESDVWRVAPGAHGVFVPEGVQRPSKPVSIADIGLSAVRTVDILPLASEHSGRIAVTKDDRSQLVPVEAQYRVELAVSDLQAAGDLAHRGVALIEGRAESLLARVWRQTLKVLLRESGA